MNLSNKQRQAINLAAAKLMGLEVYYVPNSVDEKVFVFNDKNTNNNYLYDITQNPQQMGDFIENVMMHVNPNYVDGWDAFISSTDNLSSNSDRTTAIIECAASFLGVEL